MIPAFLYSYIFSFLIVILTFVFISNRRDVYEVEPVGPSLILCLFLAIWIGLRPHSPVVGDTINYALFWHRQMWDGFNPEAENFIFDNMSGWLAENFPDATPLFVIMATINCFCTWIACRKFFPSNTMLAFLVCLIAFSSFSYLTNGIKAGAAAALFMVAMAYRDKMYISIPFLLVSWGFHHSMQLPVAVYVILTFFKDSRWYFCGWLFCLFCAAAHISFFQNLFAGMTDESGNGYLTSTEDWGGKSGFRIDFVLYSAMPVLMGYYVIFKYELRDKLYEDLLHYYLTTNGVWMLCMYGAYTNRIAYLSWFSYPFLIIYPCFAIPNAAHPLVANMKTYIYIHMSFTLFMQLVYYA